MVKVDVPDVVTEVVADDEAVDVAVEVLGTDVMVEVAVVVNVVKSQPVYVPLCQRPMARFNAAAVVAHFAYGDPPVESFRKPEALHCTVPKSSSTYGVISSRTLFRIAAPALHLSRSVNRSML